MSESKSPWTPIDLDVADKTARIRVLEVEQKHTTVAIEKLNYKVDKLSANQNKHFEELSTNIRSMKSEMMDRELQALEKKHAKELIAEREKVDTTAKVKMMWAGLGMLLSAIVAILISIFKNRLNNGG